MVTEGLQKINGPFLNCYASCQSQNKKIAVNEIGDNVI